MSKEWENIRRALENPQYKWRTVEGIAKETGYPTITIVGSLSANSDQVIKSTIPSTHGYGLFTTRDHYREMSTIWDRFESAITNKVQK